MRLIDPKLLLEDLGEEPYIWTDTDTEIQEHSDWLRFKGMIERQPTVDAVEVVRCKDCKHALENPFITGYPKLVCCKWVNWRDVELNHFCSYGERKEK